MALPRGMKKARVRWMVPTHSRFKFESNLGGQCAIFQGDWVRVFGYKSCIEYSTPPPDTQ